MTDLREYANSATIFDGAKGGVMMATDGKYAKSKMVWDFLVDTPTFRVLKVVVTTTDETGTVSTYTADFAPGPSPS